MKKASRNIENIQKQVKNVINTLLVKNGYSLNTNECPSDDTSFLLLWTNPKTKHAIQLNWDIREQWFELGEFYQINNLNFNESNNIEIYPFSVTGIFFRKKYNEKYTMKIKKKIEENISIARIGLQNKTKANKGKIELYYFKNENIGLEKTLFHRVYVPLKPFDSGLEYESKPFETEIVMEWLNLKLDNPMDLDKLKLNSKPGDEIEVSVYLGSAHNPCDINNLVFKKIEETHYEIECELFIDFEHEMIAKNEIFKFNTELLLDPEIKN